MNRFYAIMIILLLACNTIIEAAEHPYKAHIESYCEKHNINKRLNKIIAKIKPESMEFNRQGFFAYEKKQWDKAIYFFSLAITTDNSNCFAHYNYACTYALKQKNEGLSDIFTSLIIKHLRIAVELEPYYIVKIFVDPDLDSVRHFTSLGWDGEAPYLCETTIHYKFQSLKDGVIEIASGWTFDSGYQGLDADELAEGVDVDELIKKRKSYSPSFDCIEDGFYCSIGNELFIIFPHLEYNGNIVFQVGTDPHLAILLRECSSEDIFSSKRILESR